MNSLLMDLSYSWSDYITKAGSLAGGNNGWLSTLLGTLSTVLWVVIALVGAAGGIYAVFVGIKMARADSAEQREEGKKRFINVIVSVVVVIVLIIFFNVFLPMILSAVGNFTDEKNSSSSVAGKVDAISNMVTTAKVVLRLPL